MLYIIMYMITIIIIPNKEKNNNKFTICQSSGT